MFLTILLLSCADVEPDAAPPSAQATPPTFPGGKMPPDHDPAAPMVACDTSCHTTPHYPLHLKGEAEACTSCHLSDDALAAALEKAASLPPEDGVRRPHEGTLVAAQHEARQQLKGQPFATPPVGTPQPPKGMVYIPEGNFIMGSNLRWQDESPEYVLWMPAYFIDVHEVTNERYAAFVADSGRAPPSHWGGVAPPGELLQHPVTHVDWEDAIAFCRWEGKHLPSEEEWEKAARGPDGRQYPWGDTFGADRSNNPQVKSTGTQPVGSYPQGQSPYGLFDMSGNVWEWVDDWYRPHPGNTVPNQEYGVRSKISKGGSWLSCLGYNCGISAPTYNRAFLSVPTRNSSLGLRCARSIEEKGS